MRPASSLRRSPRPGHPQRLTAGTTSQVVTASGWFWVQAPRAPRHSDVCRWPPCGGGRAQVAAPYYILRGISTPDVIRLLIKLGPTGFDTSVDAQARDQSRPDSLNGATRETTPALSLSPPDWRQRATATSNGTRGLIIAARQQKRWWTAGRAPLTVGKDH